jgi:hypothetical protein
MQSNRRFSLDYFARVLRVHTTVCATNASLSRVLKEYSLCALGHSRAAISASVSSFHYPHFNHSNSYSPRLIDGRSTVRTCSGATP